MSKTAGSPDEQEAKILALVEAKVKELTKEYGKITPVIITDDEGKKVIGYLQEPEYDTIMYCTDKILDKQPSLAAEQALKNCLIAEESDPRILTASRKDAKIKVGFAMAAMALVKPHMNEYKKK